MVDPTVPDHIGVGWMSSPQTEVTLPIARSVCLVFQPGAPGYRHADATSAQVRDINIRSYAQAEWAIWGSAPRWIQETRATAKRARTKVAAYAPKKMHLVLFERMEGAPAPHNVIVHEPIEKTIRGFIRQAPKAPKAGGGRPRDE